MREWAKCRRVNRFGEDSIIFGKVLGSWSVAFLSRSITDNDYARISQRIDRIIEAKITRQSKRQAVPA
jgi:hypothetical protein